MVQLITGATFFIMLFYGADFVSALIGAVGLFAILSAGWWVNDKAESDHQSFGKWYGLTIMATFVIIAILFFTQ